MRRFFWALIASMSLSASVSAQSPNAVDSASSMDVDATTLAAITDQPVVAAMFYSSFCAACQVLEPRIESVRPDFAERDVTFIRFDKTWSALGGRRAREDLAAEHGMSAIWERYKGSQGFMLLVDPQAEEVLALVNLRHSAEEISALITAALERPAPQT